MKYTINSILKKFKLKRYDILIDKDSKISAYAKTWVIDLIHHLNYNPHNLDKLLKELESFEKLKTKYFKIY